MKRRVNRRDLIAGGVGSAGMLGLAAASAQEQPPQPAQPAQPRPKKEPLKPEMVQEWVRVAHKDLNRVKELFAEQPALLNAMWDWGGGDWESALGAAAHTGRREIAEFLLENGARFDLFAAAMLGHLDVVKVALERSPNLLQARGPHGIPLLVHAKMGGEPAKPVLEYLEGLQKKAQAEGGK